MSASAPAGTAPAIAPGMAYGLAVLSSVIWGSPPVLMRAMSASVPPLAVAFARWLIALLILLPLVWPALRSEWPRLREHWRGLALLSCLMIAGSTFSVIAVYFTTATNAVLVNASQPAVTAVFAWLIARSHLSLPQKLGIGCAFAGILVMICRGELGALLGLAINPGDLIMFLAVLGWSLYAVLLGRRGYVPSSALLLFLIALTGSVVLLPLFVGEAIVVGLFEPRWQTFATMAYLAAFPSLLATWFWNLVLHSIGPTRSAIFVNLIPVSGAALAMLFLGEQLHGYHLAGAALVFAGIWLAVRRR